MERTARRFCVVVAALFIAWSTQTGRVVAGEAPADTGKLCKAATPVPNPWTKRLPKGWWQKRHEDTLAADGRKESQIVFIGDSITDGWDQEGAGLKVWEKEYVPMKALNLGINCDSTQHVLWRLDHGAIDGLPKLKVAVVMIGVNNKGITRDPPKDIAVGIEAICDRLKQKAPQARILLLGVFPRFFGRDRNEDVNGIIAKLHDGKGVFYLNINDHLLGTEGAIRDRVGHLTEKGYEVWAERIRPTLVKLMQETEVRP
jgi:beta-glucosidase